MIRGTLLWILVILALASGFGVKFGYSAGLHHQAKPKTVTVEKKIFIHDKPDTVTLTVTKPLPQACVRLVAAQDELQANNVIIDRSVGIINAQLVELGTLTALPSITRINAVTDKIIKARDQIDTAHVHNLDLHQKVEALRVDCKAGK